ncbi:MAG TPA: helix-turn-helix transcriptional regulator [Pseudoxanthomonas sp.]
MELGERIKAARKAAGLTQAQLAAACGWDPPSRLANYEQGIREPSLADLQVIAGQVASGGWTYSDIVIGPASQPAGLDYATLESSLVAVKEAIEAADVVMDLFDKAPLIAYAYRERAKLPPQLSKPQLREFDKKIRAQLQLEVGNGRGRAADASAQGAEAGKAQKAADRRR